MGRIYFAAVASVALLVAATSAAGMTDGVRVRVAPSSVAAGDAIVVAAGVQPSGGRCSATLSHAARVLRLGPKKAVAGSVSWRSKVPVNATTGAWVARVACAKAGSATARFSVTKKPPAPPPVIPAKVVALKSGLSVRLGCSFCAYTYVGYGIVLQNISPDEDALAVSFKVNFVDASGLIVKATTLSSVGPIPAGATYYLGGDYTYYASSTPAPPVRLEVASAVVETHQPKAIGALPPVANVRVTESTATRDPHSDVLGDFTNPYTKTISSESDVSVVCFDASGNVIGGGSDHPQASVTPGGRTGFDVPVYTLTASQIASTQVSVEPYLAG